MIPMSISLKPATIMILKALQGQDGIEASELASTLQQDYIVVMSAINELAGLGLATFSEHAVDQVSLTEEGNEYAGKGLPETRVFDHLHDHGIKQVPLQELKDAMVKKGLDEKIFFIAINNLKRSRWISQVKLGNVPTVLVLKQDEAEKDGDALLRRVQEKGYLDVSALDPATRELVSAFKKRTLLAGRTFTERTLSLTAKGKKLDPAKIQAVEDVSRLTSDMITTGKWREVSLKRYDVEIAGPRLFPGKIHPLVEVVNMVREIFFSMGFSEIRGPIIESAFFNFDALFQPQDHPAREMHDTFYLDRPAKARLPDPAHVQAVAAAHENGGDTGSTGWGYPWNEDVARQVLLRTHTTATTVRQLGKAIEEGAPLPLKVFSIDRVFRNEKVDFSHLAEFMQVEGIVIGDHVTLADLRGTLVEFYTRLGFDKVITRPGFFPYTEPSMEISVYSKELDKWMEIGGSGIFRPEVCAPWGVKEPLRVLAWGQGLERIAMLRLQRKDIRDLYKNPLSWLREASYPRAWRT